MLQELGKDTGTRHDSSRGYKARVDAHDEEKWHFVWRRFCRSSKNIHSSHILFLPFFVICNVVYYHAALLGMSEDRIRSRDNCIIQIRRSSAANERKCAQPVISVGKSKRKIEAIFRPRCIRQKPKVVACACHLEIDGIRCVSPQVSPPRSVSIKANVNAARVHHRCSIRVRRNTASPWRLIKPGAATAAYAGYIKDVTRHKGSLSSAPIYLFLPPPFFYDHIDFPQYSTLGPHHPIPSPSPANPIC